MDLYQQFPELMAFIRYFLNLKKEYGVFDSNENKSIENKSIENILDTYDRKDRFEYLERAYQKYRAYTDIDFDEFFTLDLSDADMSFIHHLIEDYTTHQNKILELLNDYDLRPRYEGRLPDQPWRSFFTAFNIPPDNVDIVFQKLTSMKESGKIDYNDDDLITGNGQILICGLPKRKICLDILKTIRPFMIAKIYDELSTICQWTLYRGDDGMYHRLSPKALSGYKSDHKKFIK